MTEFFGDTGELAKKRLAEEKERRAAEQKNAPLATGERKAGRPTPTQEENDLAVLGAGIRMHDDDGSGPDPTAEPRAMAAEGAGGTYQTRQMAGKKPPTPTTPSTPPA